MNRRYQKNLLHFKNRKTSLVLASVQSSSDPYCGRGVCVTLCATIGPVFVLHLLLTGCLIVITNGVLIRRYAIERIYSLTAPFPTLIFLVGTVDEYFGEQALRIH